MSSKAIIDSITCPITATIMKDPVQGNDGQTYERSAITEWLTNHQSSSPITKQPMTINDLKVNASIRFLCDKYHAGELGITDTDINSEDKNKKSDSLRSINNPKINNSIFKNKDDSKFMVRLSVEELEDKALLSHDVVIIIDRSGSMNIPVEAKDENGNSLEDGLSQQDIVNHSAKMVAKTLGLNSNNRLCVIAFDNNIETVFNLIPMTEMNCSRAISQIDTIKPRGQTDIWRAIEEGLNILSSRTDKSRNPHMILLTDGAPNISPARGEIATLQNKMKTLNFYPPIYTFGFGYNLKPDLLYGIAKISSSATGHIPDAGMIATVFSNFIATIMCTVAYNVRLTVDFDGNNTIILPHIHGDFKYDVYQREDQSIYRIVIHIGTIQIGQSRDIIISDANIIKYTYNYQIGEKDYEVSTNINSTTQFGNEWWMDSNIVRFFLVEKIRLAIKQKQRDRSAIDLYDQMVDKFNDVDTTTEGSWGSLMYETLADQVRLALSDKPNHSGYFKRWGMWYLDQLSSALCHQIKPNFKDTACYFGGELFTNIVDYASDQFDNLPAPVPSTNVSQYRGLGGGQMRSLNSPINMSTYNSQSGPCFDGKCLVSMADGSKKMITNLVKGDSVLCSADPYNMTTTVSGKVVCILKTVISGGICEMVTFNNGLKITPWHPINDVGEWKFPFDMKDTYSSHSICGQTEVYSILLDNWHTCQINDTWCICLGHNYTQGILKHDYFGSQKIVDDMSYMRGWEKGLIVINSNDISRDIKTGMICEINQFDDTFKHTISFPISNEVDCKIPIIRKQISHINLIDSMGLFSCTSKTKNEWNVGCPQHRSMPSPINRK